MVINNNFKESAYSSDLEKYMDEQENSSNSSDFENEYNFKSKSSKLDEYVGNDKKEDDDIHYCSICGDELKKFNYGDKCDDCVKKIELVNDINGLLDYVSPSEELKISQLLSAGFDELKLNILISNLTNEHLIVFGSKGIFLADVKTLNNFFQIYGSISDILDESLYKNVIFSEDFVDISQYSDLVQIIFNSKIEKWEVSLLRDNMSVLKKYFKTVFDANNFATHYLKEIGELDNIRNKKPITNKGKKVRYRKSKHEHVYFSVKRNKWYVKFASHIRSNVVGFYDTEEEAVIARDAHIKKKRERQKILKPHKVRQQESDAIISFHERSNQWIVKVKDKKGRYKRIGYYDSEEEAIIAKNEYYGIAEESELDKSSLFSEGDKVQIISGPFEYEFGIIAGYNEERESFIVKIDNADIPYPVFIGLDKLKLI